jgi:hypothetical protein
LKLLASDRTGSAAPELELVAPVAKRDSKTAMKTAAGKKKRAS